jgi:hypothetical protein
VSAIFWEVERSWVLKGEPDWEECSFRPRALDAAGAAQEWAYQYDGQGDYTIVGGSDAHVRVRPSESEDPWQEFRVEGRQERSYYAREVHSKGPHS